MTTTTRSILQQQQQQLLQQLQEQGVKQHRKRRIGKQQKKQQQQQPRQEQQPYNIRMSVRMTHFLLLLLLFFFRPILTTAAESTEGVQPVNVSHADLFVPSDSRLFAPLPPSNFPKPTHWLEDDDHNHNQDDDDQHSQTNVTVIVEPIYGVHRPDQDAILAYAEGYTLSYYMMFLETLVNTGYKGDVVLAIAESWYAKKDVEDYLKAFHERYQEENEANGPNLIVYQHPLECVNEDRTLGTKRRLSNSGDTDIFQFCQLHHLYGWKDPHTGEIIRQAKDPRAARVVATLRYEWYWIWTQHYHPHAWIMLIDARDSYFQSNPFDGLPRAVAGPTSAGPDGLLYFFGENPDATRLGKSRKNMKWLSVGYGDSTLQALADKPTICSGSTMGEQIALETYLRALINEHDEAEVRMTGSDQGFHNFLYYSRKLTGADTIRRLVVWEQGKGMINNLGALRTKTLEEWHMYDVTTHYVYQWDGVTLSPVVHQWDRDKNLHSWMQGKHRTWTKHYEDHQGKVAPDPLFPKATSFQEVAQI